MAYASLTNDVREFLRGANPAVVSTTRADGHPVSVPTWYALESDDRLLLNMDHSRVRLKHMRRDPRISLTVLGAEDWYHYVSLAGEVVEFAEDADLVEIDRLCQRYWGKECPTRDSPRLNAWMKIERWHAQ